MALRYLPAANVVVLALMVQTCSALDSARHHQRGNVYGSVVVQTDDLLIVPGSVRVDGRSHDATAVGSVVIPLDDTAAVGPDVDSPVNARVARDGRACSCELMPIVVDTYPRRRGVVRPEAALSPIAL